MKIRRNSSDATFHMWRGQQIDNLCGHVQDEQHLWGFGVENFTNKRWQQDRQRHKDKNNSKEGKRSKQHQANKHGDPQTWEHIFILFISDIWHVRHKQARLLGAFIVYSDFLQHAIGPCVGHSSFSGRFIFGQGPCQLRFGF